jgi:hypothetical protein
VFERACVCLFVCVSGVSSRSLTDDGYVFSLYKKILNRWCARGGGCVLCLCFYSLLDGMMDQDRIIGLVGIGIWWHIYIYIYIMMVDLILN